MKSAGLFVSCVALYKKNLVRNALATHKGNQSAAAEYLGIHRNTMNRMVHEFGLKPEKGTK